MSDQARQKGAQSSAQPRNPRKLESSPGPSPGHHPPQRAKEGNESAQPAVRRAPPGRLRRAGRCVQARSRVRGRGEGQAVAAGVGAWGRLQSRGWRAGVVRGWAGGRAPGPGPRAYQAARSCAPGSGRGRRGPGRAGRELHRGLSPVAYPAATSFRLRCSSRGITGNRGLLAGARLPPLTAWPEAPPSHCRLGDASRKGAGDPR